MATKETNTGIPQQAIEKFARCLLPEIEKFFDSEAGKQEFAEWKKTQQSNEKGTQN